MRQYSRNINNIKNGFSRSQSALEYFIIISAITAAVLIFSVSVLKPNIEESVSTALTAAFNVSMQ